METSRSWDPQALWGLASHELRGPLSAAVTRLELAQRQVRGTSAEESLVLAIESLRRLGRTLDAIDELNGAGRGLHRRLERVSVAGLLESLANDHRLVSGRGIEVSCADGLWLQAPRGLLEQALSNLIANAIKYSDPPTIVRLQARLEGDACAIHVEDDGIGIPPEDLERLSVRNARGNNVADRPGRGLGLYVARELLASLGARIEVRSLLGAGTRFTVIVPRLAGAS